MPTISAQIAKLKQQIKLPFQIKFVNHVVDKKDFEEKVIYIHITI